MENNEINSKTADNSINNNEQIFVINASDDTSANFDLIIRNRIDEANNINSMINFKVQLIRTDNIYARKNNLVDEIVLPIAPTSKPENETTVLTQYIYARLLSLDNDIKNEKYPDSKTSDNLKFVENLKIFNDAKNSVNKGKENSDWKKISNQILDYHNNTFVNQNFKEKEIIE